MRTQISRLSPHQNGKVFGVLMGIATLVFSVPMFFVLLNMPPGMDMHGNPVGAPPGWLAIFFPVAYLVMGYIMVVLGCALYNLMFRFIGGIEFETREQDAPPPAEPR